MVGRNIDALADGLPQGSAPPPIHLGTAPGATHFAVKLQTVAQRAVLPELAHGLLDLAVGADLEEFH